MKIPMLSHMKIMTPNKELFERLGNVYPLAEFFELKMTSDGNSKSPTIELIVK